MAASRSCLVCLIVLVFLSSSFLMLSAVAATSREIAVSSVSEAEQSLSQAFVAVSGAEKAGANVSSLLVRLSEGADLLSQSRLAFDTGSFDEAVRLANLSTGVSGEVWDEAARLSVEVSDAAVDRGWWFLAISVVAVSIVLVASAVGYRYLRGTITGGC